MSAQQSQTLWYILGWTLTYLTIGALLALSVTELVGARVRGFDTISAATRNAVAKGDFRLYVAVLSLFLLGALWWTLHVFRKL